jgi:SAM-dependent methyltransferase
VHTPTASPVAASRVAAPHVATPQEPGATALETLVGERTVPGLWHENYWFRRHEAAYLRLAPLLAEAARAGGVVVEAGAGEGYGTGLLRAAGCDRVAALDYDAASVRHGAGRYPAAAWARGNLARLPLAAGSVAAVSSFQVVEHLWTPWEFLAECARVLRPGGPLVLTTPNRPVFSPGVARGERPPNPYHVREFDADELRESVAPHLVVESVLGLVHGARLRAWEARHGSAVTAQLRTPPAGWDAEVAAIVASVTADDFELVPVWPTPRPAEATTTTTTTTTTTSPPATIGPTPGTRPISGATIGAAAGASRTTAATPRAAGEAGEGSAPSAEAAGPAIEAAPATPDDPAASGGGPAVPAVHDLVVVARRVVT